MEPTLEELLAAMPDMGSSMTAVSALADQHAQLVKEFEDYDVIKLASSFAALLLEPSLQSNCFRLEVLVHLAVAFAHGTRKPNASVLKKFYADIGDGPVSMWEDPAESVFVSVIPTPHGNFRVLDGIWESGSFWAERVAQVVEGMPNTAAFEKMKRSVLALLTLSEIACDRAALARNQLGSEVKAAQLSNKIADRVRSSRRFVKFSEQDLTEHGFSKDDLTPFIIYPADVPALRGEEIGNTILERKPMAVRDGYFYLLLPTAVTAAVRRFVVDEVTRMGLTESFLKALGANYAHLFKHTSLLGGDRHDPVSFQRTRSGAFAGYAKQIDAGRYLSFTYWLDTLEGFDDGGLADENPNGVAISRDIVAGIDQAYDAVSKEPGFQSLITVIVTCGIGRAARLEFDCKHPNWRMVSISAANLVTLSNLEKFTPLSLVRLLDAKDRLRELGVHIQNVNGLLNLIAWARSLDGHLVPHAQVPADFGTGDGPSMMMIEQNALRELRHQVATDIDSHMERLVSGGWQRIRKDTGSHFAEDRRHPIYISEQWSDGQNPRAAYISDQRVWWLQFEVPKDTATAWKIERWRMLTTWLRRLVPPLEKSLRGLPDGPVLLHVIFEGTEIGTFPDDEDQMTFAQARAEISVSADRAASTVRVVTSADFDWAFVNVENIAEHALVDAFMSGFELLCSRPLEENKRSKVMREIVPDTLARQTHAIRGYLFRDFVRPSLPDDPTLIDEDDEASFRLGLGWKVRNRNEGGDIKGVEACTQYLNRLAKHIEQEIAADLREFDRAFVLNKILETYETAIANRDNWSRTSGAVIALHDDKVRALETITKNEFQLNAVFQATRLLLEVAICECPLTGGTALGELDLSRLMAKVAYLHHLGGWSDAIRWKAMEPHVIVRPQGDVHLNFEFHDNIVMPFGRSTSELRTNSAIDDYPTLLKRKEEALPIASVFEAEFLAAWSDQFGVSLEYTAKFVAFVEKLGVDRNTAILKVRKSDFYKKMPEFPELTSVVIDALLAALTLKTRKSWLEPPEGYEEKDRQLWRFRRRLSVLRKPILQYDEGPAPQCIVAPGLLRDAFDYMIGNYHRGDFPIVQLVGKMKVWAGAEKDRRGKEFGQEVSSKLNGLGWETDTEVKITRLLNKGFDRDYGDVDVLAWRRDNGRVLIIECKDLQYRKTFGEIAEQLSDFAGEIRSSGKRDDLRKHLDRMTVISDHLAELAKFIGWDSVIRVESHLVFRNPVPMQHAAEQLAERVAVHLLSDIGNI